jgi:hypothetical protein
VKQIIISAPVGDIVLMGPGDEKGLIPKEVIDKALSYTSEDRLHDRRTKGYKVLLAWAKGLE